jgi:hypothetical protein
VLPCSATVPQTSVLFNYDANYDSAPGRTIKKGGSGPDETDLARYQSWSTGPLGVDFTVQGTVQVELWGAVKDFATDKAGVVRVYLRDISGPSATIIGQGTTVFASTSGDWFQRGVGMSITPYTVPAGHELELKIIVASNSGDDMWFAYDTASYRSRIAGY